MSGTLNRFSYVATDEDAGERVDRVLAAKTMDLSRARVQGLIHKGCLTAGPVIVTDPAYKLRKGDILSLSLPPAEPMPLRGEPMSLDILFEDGDILVLNKPAGLVVHPGAGNKSGTLVHALLAHCGESLSGIGGVARPGIVHRLDKDTSGVMVVAKNDLAHAGLAAQFADHGRVGDLRREYLAIVWGKPEPRTGRIETQIGRHSASRVKMAVLKSGGRSAITHYQIQQTFTPVNQQEKVNNHKRRGAASHTLAGGATISLASCRLETGRTHQVRVHMAHLGTPIIGDAIYGGGFQSKIRALPETVSRSIMLLKRQALHAAVLAFRHPRTRKIMAFKQAVPNDMADILKALASLDVHVSKN